MNVILGWVKDRLREPSTYAGIAAALLAIGVQVDEATLSSIGAIVVAVLAMVLGDKKS